MPALIFDLDGTPVDTVSAHVFAWQRALNERGLDIDGWKIRCRVGMSGGLFTRAIARTVHGIATSGRLTRAGAFRVDRDAEELRISLDELGVG